MSALKAPAVEFTSKSEVPWNMVRLMGRMPPLAPAGTTSWNPSSSPDALMQWVGRSFRLLFSTMMLSIVWLASFDGSCREKDFIAGGEKID
jgi:hypothetical protein